MRPDSVLAMYDVRGIQDYIFRTDREKDAIGASSIIQNIIEDALEDAVVKELKWMECKDLLWDGMKFEETNVQVQVLFIGGGNAYIIYDTEEHYKEVNKIMAKYIIEKTYSLQLVTACVPIKGDYEDYEKALKELRSKMDDTKAKMVVTKPLGALPIMKTELITGYPAFIVSKQDNELISKESDLKEKEAIQIRNNHRDVDRALNILDSYVTKKGTDSTIAVVHIDGNNMGLRIRKQMAGIRDYKIAVDKMRIISHNIAHCYEEVFEDMAEYYNTNAGKDSAFTDKENKYFVLKILAAGDDITYICNGKIALSTVNYFIKHITQRSMTEGLSNNEGDEFSACAGIAFINSHFPFNIGYEVAEACCANAKNYAKDYAYEHESNYGETKQSDVSKEVKIGNWIDFQICRNIQAHDLSVMREREYHTSHDEMLLQRPYCILTKGSNKESVDIQDPRSYDSLVKKILYFQNKKNIPRSWAKKLRNTYPQGENRVQQLYLFLQSRKWEMPDGSSEFYNTEELEGKSERVAKWYDALEMMDYFVDPNLREEQDDEQTSGEN